jgi:crossover junction endodeoxyribonuclease RuvC
VIVVGLDLSLTSTGVAWLDGHQHGCYHIPTDEKAPMGERLDRIKSRVWQTCNSAELVVVEFLYKGAKGIEATAQVHGLISWMLWRDRVPTRYIPPSNLKTFALGKGVGSKTEMTLAASRRLGYEGCSDDEADALWLAHLGAHLLGRPAVDLPQSHLRALAKIKAVAA